MRPAKMKTPITTAFAFIVAAMSMLLPIGLQAESAKPANIAKCGAPILAADTPATVAKSKGVGPPGANQVVVDGGPPAGKKVNPVHYSDITADMKAKNPRLRGPDTLPVIDAADPGARLAARLVVAGPACTAK
jgi:hypothetical protein